MTQAPSSLHTLIGNDQIKELLPRIKSQTLLLSGPAGVGKATFALAHARDLLGPKKEHPDLLHLEPEGKINKHPIENIRKLITFLTTPPFEATRKIVIIEDAEKMLPYAANALLKTLEEPPTYALLILTSSHPDQLLPTILSRCTQLPFKPLTRPQICAFLNDHPDTDTIATLCQGSLSLAQKLISGELSAQPILDHLDGQPLTGDPAELLPLLFYWQRDRHLINAGATTHLFFKDHIERLKSDTRPLPSLESLHQLFTDALTAVSRGIKLSAFLTVHNQ